MSKAIGERLKKIRLDHGLTQVALSAKINIANSVIADVEAGRRTPSKEMAKRLATEFKMPIETFLIEDVSDIPTSTVISPETMIDILYTIHEFLEENHLTMSSEQEKQLLKSFCESDCHNPEVIKQTLSTLRGVNSDIFIKGK